MEKNKKLEDLIKIDSNKQSYIDVVDMPKKVEMEAEGYNFVDEKGYIIRTAAYISLFSPEIADFAQSLVYKRDFPREFENLRKINEIIPKNSVKPIALVYDNSISKNYIRGYITKTDSSLIPLRDYLNLEKEKIAEIDAGNVNDIENQLLAAVDKLKASNMYNKLPEETFSLDNIYITENNKVILMNMNNLLCFSDKNPKYLDKELKKTIKYLEKSRKKLSYMNRTRNNPAQYY